MLEIWKEHENISDMSPCALFVGGNFDEFLIQTQNFRQNPPERFVSSTLFFVMKDNEIIGWVDIRHNIWTEYLKNFGGHIGYGILPTERGKWYATQALAHAVQEAKNLIAQWVKELILIAQDSTRYGVDLYGKARLFDLLEASHYRAAKKGSLSTVVGDKNFNNEKG